MYVELNTIERELMDGTYYGGLLVQIEELKPLCSRISDFAVP